MHNHPPQNQCHHTSFQSLTTRKNQLTRYPYHTLRQDNDSTQSRARSLHKTAKSLTRNNHRLPQNHLLLQSGPTKRQSKLIHTLHTIRRQLPPQNRNRSSQRMPNTHQNHQYNHSASNAHAACQSTAKKQLPNSHRSGTQEQDPNAIINASHNNNNQYPQSSQATTHLPKPAQIITRTIYTP